MNEETKVFHSGTGPQFAEFMAKNRHRVKSIHTAEDRVIVTLNLVQTEDNVVFVSAEYP